MKKRISLPIAYLFTALILVCTNCKSEPKMIPLPSVKANTESIADKPSLVSETGPSTTTQSSTDSIIAKADDAETITNTATHYSSKASANKSAPVQDQDTKPKQAEKPKKKVLPKMTFEELVWDFGEITEGDVIDKKFKFTNTGNATLQIHSTKATCGCTRPSFPFLDIAPGESNFIGVNYNSVGKEGKQSAEITIKANTIPKITTLKLKGIVKPKENKSKDKVTKIDTSASEN